MATLVKFYKEVNGGNSTGFDILAVFPEENYTDRNTLTKTCYSTVGQHSACTVDYVNGLLPAKKAEYQELLQELVNQGYDDLKVLNK